MKQAMQIDLTGHLTESKVQGHILPALSNMYRSEPCPTKISSNGYDVLDEI